MVRIFENIDCMIGMDKYKDILTNRKTLAIVDPPYGIGDKFKSGVNSKMNFKEIPNKDWDKKPDAQYFNMLFSLTQNQIIWGGNNYELSATRCFLVWDKLISEDFSLSMAELAWTSFDKNAKIIRLFNPRDNKIHPTQKPIKLYKWLLENYAKDHDLILDTHVGSASSLIACEEYGIDYIGFELDMDYYNSAKERLEKARFIRENKTKDECYVDDLELFTKRDKDV